MLGISIYYIIIIFIYLLLYLYRVFVNDLSHSIINVLFYILILFCLVPYNKVMSSRVSTYTFLPTDEVIEATTNGDQSKTMYKSEIEYYFKNGIQQKIQFEVMVEKVYLYYIFDILL